MVERAQEQHNKPDVLTKGPDGQEASDKFSRRNREAAQRPWRNKYGKPPKGKNWDEYPYASTYEGGRGAYAELVDKEQNQGAGGKLTQFYRKNGVKDGCRFRVKVVE